MHSLPSPECRASSRFVVSCPYHDRDSTPASGSSPPCACNDCDCCPGIGCWTTGGLSDRDCLRPGRQRVGSGGGRADFRRQRTPPYGSAHRPRRQPCPGPAGGRVCAAGAWAVGGCVLARTADRSLAPRPGCGAQCLQWAQYRGGAHSRSRRCPGAVGDSAGCPSRRPAPICSAVPAPRLQRMCWKIWPAVLT